MLLQDTDNVFSFTKSNGNTLIKVSSIQEPENNVKHDDVLSSLVFYRTYAKTLEAGRKETPYETISRVAEMHIEKFPHLRSEISDVFSYVHAKKVVPSMRSMQFSGEPIKRSNSRLYNCFSRSTEFLTKDGIKSFNDFEDGDVVTVLSDHRMWKTATVRKFGREKLVKLTIGRGRTVEEIFTTNNHRWITLSSDNSTSVTRKEKTTSTLVADDILPTNRKTIDLTKPCSIAIQHGIVFGDGTFTKATGACSIALCDDSQELLNRFSTGNVLVKGNHGGPVSDRQTYVTDLPYNWKKLPDLTANTDYLFGFLAGWFSADGSVSGGNVTLASSSKEHLEWARSAFSLLGIGTGRISISRDLSPFTGEPAPLYRINIFKESIVSEFFLRSHHKKSFKPFKLSLKWRVLDVEPLDREEEVWCVQEPDTETFTLACGVLTKNCAFTAVTSFQDVGDIFFKLMNGCGVGYSIQARHVTQLPMITDGHTNAFIVEDNKESWADSMVALLENPKTLFDYSQVRKHGAKLSTGGTSSGPEPLRVAHEKTREVLQHAAHRQLTPLEVHSVVTLTSDCVVVGGVRRAALICLFDADDNDMLRCKHGEWWVNNPHFGRANNSAVIHREDPNFNNKLMHVMQMCFDSNAGEPGVFLTNDYDCGVNPCVPAGTQILTRDGYRNIEKTVDTTLDVWNGFEWSSVTPKITGRNQPLVTVSLSSGQSLTCTPAHKWVLSDGRRVTAEQLKHGDRLLKTKMPVIKSGNSEYEGMDPYTQGFYSGDGTNNSNYILVYPPKRVCLSRLKYISSSEHASSDRTRITATVKPDKSFVPVSYDFNFRINWLSGLIDADGCVTNDGQVQVCSVDKQFLLGVQKLLTTLGVTSKVTKGDVAGDKFWEKDNTTYAQQDSYRLGINAVQVQSLVSVGLVCERVSLDFEPNRDASRFVQVQAVIPAGVADVVYCFTEEKNHTGCFEGIVTGQCGEISLRDGQMCNLTETNISACDTEEDFKNAVMAATAIGTIQATYTDFNYVQDKWKYNCDDEALLGVSITGQAEKWDMLGNPDFLKECAAIAVSTNERWAKMLGTKPAARIGCTKPSGSTSAYLGTTSGIHAAHSDFYLRRVRVDASDPVATYLIETFGLNEPCSGNILEQDLEKPDTNIVVTIPINKNGAIVRSDETAIELLERAKHIFDNWIKPTHRSGANMHNVSLTVSYKEHEKKDIMQWVLDNKESYAGIAFLPYSDHTYKQAPFEEITETEYKSWMKLFGDKVVDFSTIDFSNTIDKRNEEAACSGGLCELR